MLVAGVACVSPPRKQRCRSSAVRPPTIRRQPVGPSPLYPQTQSTVSGFFDAALAFVAGLSVLVRPELALVGGLALVMMLIAATQTGGGAG